MHPLSRQIVLSVRHWTDTLFSFACKRDPSFCFNSGQFAMVGLDINDQPLTRAYGIASPNSEQGLEFLSVKVPDGPLTSRLHRLQVGEPVLVSHQPSGTLVLDNLLPGRTGCLPSAPALRHS
jgi:ferredoxin--NADP+ reductase